MTDDHENQINGIFKSVCKPKQCNEYYNCDTNANCLINENTQKYECTCKPGSYQRFSFELDHIEDAFLS